MSCVTSRAKPEDVTHSLRRVERRRLTRSYGAYRDKYTTARMHGS